MEVAFNKTSACPARQPSDVAKCALSPGPAAGALPGGAQTLQDSGKTSVGNIQLSFQARNCRFR